MAQDESGDRHEEYKHIIYSKSDEGITTIFLDRPKVLNAFNMDMKGELRGALERFKYADKEKALVLVGSGNVFSAGEDTSGIDLDADEKTIEHYAKETLRLYHEIVIAILMANKPIIAALNGAAIGAGLSIALACDERFAIRDNRNFLVPAFSGIGLIPDSGIIATLERLVGYEQARRWLTDPKCKISFHDAETHEIIRESFPDHSSMMRRVRDFAGKLISSHSFDEYACTKDMFNSRMVRDLQDNIFPTEVRYQAHLLQTEYFKEKLKAFREKNSEKESSDDKPSS